MAEVQRIHSGNAPWRTTLREYTGMLIVLVGVVAVFTLLDSRLLTLNTVRVVLSQIPAITLLATGMTLVLIVGGIDLSVGSVLALSSCTMAVLMRQYDWSPWMAMPAAILVGTVCGLLNGSVSVYASIPSFIVTLGMMQIARGSGQILTANRRILALGLEWLTQPIVGVGVSPALLFAVGIAVLAHLIVTYTVFGRYCIAVGTSERAFRMSGLDSRPVRVIVFAAAGTLAGMAGVIEMVRLHTGDPDAGGGYELKAIAAAVIGGTSLMGGRGNVLNTIMGVLIIAVIETGLNLVGASTGAKLLTTGGIIVAAVLLDAQRHRLR
ncbi:MAG: ABC transporter permease, partial [Planctomycetaceae bacterium]|nr:ABC transporter permease [Planctomycetaceae bacterium]